MSEEIICRGDSCNFQMASNYDEMLSVYTGLTKPYTGLAKKKFTSCQRNLHSGWPIIFEILLTFRSN
jgi:hypothetical protein